MLVLITEHTVAVHRLAKFVYTCRTLSAKSMYIDIAFIGCSMTLLYTGGDVNLFA